MCMSSQSHKKLVDGVVDLAKRVQADKELTALIRRKFAIKCTTGAMCGAHTQRTHSGLCRAHAGYTQLQVSQAAWLRLHSRSLRPAIRPQQRQLAMLGADIPLDAAT